MLVTSAVLDACVLYSASLRDLFMRIASKGFVHIHWTEEIHEEWILHLSENKNIPREKLEVLKNIMNAVLPAANITGYAQCIPNCVLPDPHDRHVLRAAVKQQAQAIVTLNTKDFPQDICTAYGVQILHPDTMLCDFLQSYPQELHSILNEQRSALKNPPYTEPEFYAKLQNCGLKTFASAVRLHLLTIP